MNLNPDQIKDLSLMTINHYDVNAESFWYGTKDYDVSQNYDALLNAINSKTSLKILDFGCGPGRDLIYFKSKGHEPIGLDGSIEFVKLAREVSGVEVWHQNFIDLQLPDLYFDAIFANASLFHIPSQEFIRVLKELNNTLKEDGVMFCSNPRGNGEGFSGSRYGAYYEIDDMTNFLNQTGFEIIDHYYRPKGLPREEQPWLAIVAKKVSNKY